MELLTEEIKWEEAKIKQIVQSLDHKDKNKITWTEFLEWFQNEGKIRYKIHQASLYKSGLTRIVEDNTFRLSQKRTEYKVESVYCLDVENGRLDLLLCIFENKIA